MFEIESGLFSGMVMQRRRGDVTAQPIVGRVKAALARTLRVRVLAGKRALSKFDSVEVAKLTNGRFSFVLKGLGVGGPYSVQLSAVDAGGRVIEVLRCEDVYVGDAWILAGQSNMEGIGWMEDRLQGVAQVRAFYMDHSWGPAEDPLHELEKSVVSVHHRLHGGRAPVRPPHMGVGPGVAFGQTLHQRLRIPVGLLACAHGGTSMEQWDPKGLADGHDSLFGAAIFRLKLNGGGAAGVYWYQGCSDTNHTEDVESYHARMRRLIAAFRRQAKSPKLPFVVVQISRFVSDDASPANWSSIREQQRLLPTKIANVATVPAIDLDLDDAIHVSGQGQNRLGARSAEAALYLMGGAKLGPEPLRVGKLRVVREPHTGLANVEVEFEGVVGGLKSHARPAGFSLHLASKPVGVIFKTVLSGNKVILMTGRVPIDVAGLELAYGYGTDPYCNIVDAQDRSLPAFGPVSLGKRRFLTEFADDVEVSRLVPLDQTFKALKYPSASAELGFARRHFGPSGLGVFLSLRPEIEAFRKDAVVYFRMFLEAPEPLSGRLCLGYDGPLKIWHNRREIFFDPTGTNPVSMDEAFAKLELKRGRSEVLVALGTNHGNAWGIVVRFERLNVARAGSKTSAPALPRFLSE